MKVLWLLPERPAGAPSGGDLYDALVIAGLRKRGHRVEVSATVPSRVRADVVVQDALGFARFLPFNRALEREGNSAWRVALVHVTTARLRPALRTESREARYLASTHASVFVSAQAKRESLRLLGLRGLESAVISPGADRLPRRAAVRSKGPLRLICVGHLSPQKGQLELLEASSALGATLVLAGDGTIDRAYTAKVVARLRELPNARWVGPLGPAALARALAASDVFINASQYESWGMAAAEAHFAGLPVVSCSSGGLWEFLTPGVDSLRVRTLNRTALEPLRERGLVRRLSEGARRAPKRTWALAACEFEAFLEGRPR